MANVTQEKGRSRVRIDSDVEQLESDFATLHPLVSWRSVIAGLLVAFLCFAILSSLGLAFGGLTLNNVTPSASSAGIATGIWFLIASLVSLFVGSYFAARISKFHTNRIGSAQGIVIAALFFGLFMWQIVATIGWAGRTTGSAVGGATSAIGAGLQQASQNPMIRNTVENAMADLNLKSSPEVVAGGVLSRIVQGDENGAKNYLAAQAGIPPAEADRRINDLTGQINSALDQAGQAAARAMQGAGWSLFFTLVLGSAAAISGGAMGSRANLRKPLTREQVEAVSAFTTAPV